MENTSISKYSTTGETWLSDRYPLLVEVNVFLTYGSCSYGIRRNFESLKAAVNCGFTYKHTWKHAWTDNSKKKKTNYTLTYLELGDLCVSYNWEWIGLLTSKSICNILNILALSEFTGQEGLHLNIFSVTEYLTSALPHSNSLGGEAAFHMPPSTRAGESAATIGGETPKGKLKCSVNRYNSPNFVRDELACCFTIHKRTNDLLAAQYPFSQVDD